MLINRYTYNKNHGISFHDDIKEGYDVDKDPITSFSCRLGSLLVIISSRAPEKQEKTEGKRAFVVYQPPGTILVMGGKFQRAYKHGVPSFQEIKELLACADDLTTWDGVKLKLEWFSNSKDLMRQEVRRIDVLESGQRARRTLERHNAMGEKSFTAFLSSKSPTLGKYQSTG